jgi:hypothetical protein
MGLLSMLRRRRRREVELARHLEPHAVAPALATSESRGLGAGFGARDGVEGSRSILLAWHLDASGRPCLIAYAGGDERAGRWARRPEDVRGIELEAFMSGTRDTSPAVRSARSRVRQELLRRELLRGGRRA